MNRKPTTKSKPAQYQSVNIRIRILKAELEMKRTQQGTVEHDVLDIECHMLKNMLQKDINYTTQEYLQSFRSMLRDPLRRYHYLAIVSSNLYKTLIRREESGILDGDKEGIYMRNMQRDRVHIAEQMERAFNEIHANDLLN